MDKSIYIFSDGEIKRKGNTIYFETEAGKKYIPVENTRELLIFGEVTINKRFLDFVSQQEIILHFFNYYGYYSGTYYPREHYNSGHMIVQQAQFYLDEEKRLHLAKQFTEGAVQNISRILSYYRNRGKELQIFQKAIDNLAPKIDKVKDISALMAVEGNFREQYYQSFNIILDHADFPFGTRSRRPPKTRLNALISFGNSLLYTTVLSEIYKTHLDPRIGFLHTSNFRSFSLNLDVAEIFKPIIIDRIIFSLINKNQLQKKDFEAKTNKVLLNEKGRKTFVTEYEDRLKTTIKHKRLRRNVSYRQLILLELYKLEKHLLQEKIYEPFVARW